MNIRRWLSGVACLVGAALALSSACINQPPVTEVPDPVAGQPVPPVRAAFTVFLSSERPRVIRDDANEGAVALTAQSSLPATYEWSVDAPAGLLQVQVPAEDEVATSSVLRVLRVLRDPGFAGTMVTVTVTATEVVEGAEAARESTSQVVLEIVRPRGSLTVTSSSLSGSTVTPGARVSLRARISGGRQFPVPVDTPACTGTGTTSPPNDGLPYNVTWTVTGLGGGTLEVACLRDDDGETIADATYRAPIAVGNLVFTVQASDASGNRVSNSIPVVVSSAETLAFVQASAERSTVEPGRSVNLSAIGRGGTPPYSITFSINTAVVNGSIGAAGLMTEVNGDTESVTCPSRGFDEACEVVYSASATNDGSDLVTVSLEDAVGATASTTIPLIIASRNPLRLTATSTNATVEPGGGTNIVASPTGGTPPYRVCFTVSGPTTGTLAPGQAGCGAASENCTCNLGSLNSTTAIQATRAYTAAIAEGSDIVSVRVTDAVGAEATAIVPLVIRTQAVLSLSAFAGDAALDPGGTTTITATATGGKPPYRYSFTKKDNVVRASAVPPVDDTDLSTIGGIPAVAVPFESGLEGGAFDVTYQGHGQNWFTANSQLNLLNVTDVITVTVVDSVQQSRTTSFTILVGTLSSFDVLLRIAPSQIAPGQDADIFADIRGGSVPIEVRQPQLVNVGLGGSVTAMCPAVCGGVFPCSLGSADLNLCPPLNEDFVVTYTAPMDQIGEQQILLEFVDNANLSVLRVANVPVLSGPLTVVGTITNPVSGEVAPNGIVTIEAVVSGGAGAQRVEIEALGLGGGTFVPGDCGTATKACLTTPPYAFTYTAPRSEGDVLFRITATGVVPGTAVDFVPLRVRSAVPLAVSASLNLATIVPLGSTTLTATVTGGTPDYTVVVTNLGPLGGSIPLNGSVQAGPGAGPQFMFDYDAPNTPGTAQFRVDATDDTGAMQTTFALLTVQPATNLIVTLVANETTVNTTMTTMLTATATGGTPPYTYEFSIDPPPGTGEGLSGQAPPNPTTGASTITYTAPTDPKIAVVRVAVMDAANNQASDNQVIQVIFDPLTVTVDYTTQSGTSANSPTEAFVFGNEAVNLMATTSGGVGTKTFQWSVNPTNSGTFSSATIANPTWTSPAFVPAGGNNDYVLSVRVSDSPAQGQQQTVFSSDLTIHVLQTLSGNLTVSASPTVNSPVTVTANITGGLPPYNFAWTVTGPPPGNVDQTDTDMVDETFTFTPTTATNPANPNDRYRANLVVTDAAGNVFTPTELPFNVAP